MTNNNPFHGFGSPQREEDDIDESEIFHILGNDRRREIITILARESKPVNVSYLAEAIAEMEGSAESSKSLYKSVYVSLQQTHIPKLLEEDIVHYDQESKTVRPGPRLDAVTKYVDHSNNGFQATSAAPLLISLVGLLFVLGSMYQVPGVSAVAVGVWAIIFLALVAATSALDTVR